MDFKLPSFIDSKYMETSPSIAVNKPVGTKSGHFGSNGNPDALHAVKMDPAVLEAQVTVDIETRQNAAAPKIQIETNAKEAPIESPSKDFEDMLSQHVSALLSLTPDRLQELMKYADNLRRQRMSTQNYTECVFCKNNGEAISWYMSHILKDSRGRVRCPVLRAFRCPRCGATGDRAHTIKYCHGADTDARGSIF